MSNPFMQSKDNAFASCEAAKQKFELSKIECCRGATESNENLCIDCGNNRKALHFPNVYFGGLATCSLFFFRFFSGVDPEHACKTCLKLVGQGVNKLTLKLIFVRCCSKQFLSRVKIKLLNCNLFACSC